MKSYEAGNIPNESKQEKSTMESREAQQEGRKERNVRLLKDSPTPEELVEREQKAQNELCEARERLGLPPLENEEKEESASQEETEKRIQEEKEKIVQEKIDQLLEEFKTLAPELLQSLAARGATPDNQPYKSNALGALDAATAQSFASAIQTGVKLLPEILKAFDAQITAEATERVAQQVARERASDEVPERLESEEPVVSESEDASNEQIPVDSNSEKPASSEPEETLNSNGAGVAFGENNIVGGAGETISVEQKAETTSPESRAGTGNITIGSVETEGGGFAAGPGAIAYGRTENNERPPAGL